MKVKELRNILEIVDGECEVLVVNQYYTKQTTDNEVPFCLRVEN